MAQPVRKNIAELHPEVSEQSEYTLIIDGTNLLRISFADDRVNTDGVHYGGIFQFLLQMKIMLKKKDFDYVYVFFDDEDSGILRYQIYNGYKANRDKHYEEHSEELSDYMKEYNATLKRMQNAIFNKEKKVKELTPQEKLVKENFARERDMLLHMFNDLYIRWIFDDKTEGDDLIAYYVKNKKPSEKVVIMSGDEDLTQLISDTVCIYNPRLKKFLSDKNFKEIKGFVSENVVINKIFCGDVSDNIGKIDGVSEARLFELMPELRDRPVTINEIKERAAEKIEERKNKKQKPLKWHQNIVEGKTRRPYNGDFYEINNKLVNLKLPLLTDEAREELDSMMYAPMDPEGRSEKNLYSFIHEHNLTELLNVDRFASFFVDFKPLINKELKRYKKFMENN